MPLPAKTHSIFVGYILWLFGFTGSHRFYYGKPVTGTIWFFTLGLLFIGWFIDLLLIPGMDRRADLRYQSGPLDYTLAWILLTFLGYLGIHRFYLGKWITGLLYMFTGGLFLLGWLYDLWTLNEQVSERNAELLALIPGRNLFVSDIANDTYTKQDSSRRRKSLTLLE